MIRRILAGTSLLLLVSTIGPALAQTPPATEQEIELQHRTHRYLGKAVDNPDATIFSITMKEDKLISPPGIDAAAIYYGTANGGVVAFGDYSIVGAYITGGAVQGAPAVSEGWMFAASADSNLYGFAKDTTVTDWNYKAAAPFSTSPCIAGTLVVAASDDGSVHAVAAESGKLAWKTETGTAPGSPAYDNGVIYVGTAEPAVYAISISDGGRIWRSGAGGGSTMLHAGLLFCLSADGALLALDPGTGAERWRFQAPDAGALAQPSAADDLVLIASPGSGVLFALDAASGSERWQSNVGRMPSAPAATAENYAYIGTFDSQLHCIDLKSGRELWSKETGFGYAPPSTAALLGGSLYYVGKEKLVIFENTEEQADPSERDIFQASFEGDTALTALRLATGTPADTADSRGRTALMFAAWNGQTDIVRLLLAQGADINRRDDRGLTPLLHTVMEDQEEMVSYLIERGADVQARSDAGTSAVGYAAEHERNGNIGILLRNGAAAGIADTGGITPLMTAAEKGYDDIIRTLVGAGAPVDAQDTARETALHKAALNRNIEAVRLLLAAGANPNAASRRKVTPLIYGAYASSGEIVEMLLEKKADPNGTEEDGYTALMFAAQNNCPACIKSLLARKANTRPKNALGMTALDVARMQKNEEITRLLLKAERK